MGLIIAFSGIDGCGKTAIIDETRKVLMRKGQSSKYVWLRYNHYLTKVLLAFCRLTGLTKYEDVNGLRVGYHEFHRSKFVSYLFILLTYLDLLAATVVRIYVPSLFSRQVILCDRWVFDIMVDLEVDTGISFAPGTFLAKVFRGLIAQNAVCFLIVRDFDIVRKTRWENIFDRNFPKRFELFQRLSGDSRIKVIDNSGSIQGAVEKLIEGLSKVRAT